MTPGGDDERALIAWAQGGDARAFEELVRRHADRLHDALRRWGLDEADAQDVAWETFVRAWQSLPGFRVQSQFYTWLYRIGFNETQRRLARRPPAEAIHPDGRDQLDRVADTGAGPTRQLEESELRGALERELRTLPVALRAPVVLRDIEGLIRLRRPRSWGSRRRRSRAACTVAGCSCAGLWSPTWSRARRREGHVEHVATTRRPTRCAGKRPSPVRV